MLNTCKWCDEPELALGQSRERVSNTWVIYLRVGNNTGKLVLIPHDILWPNGRGIKAGDRKAWRLKMSPRPIS